MTPVRDYVRVRGIVNRLGAQASLPASLPQVGAGKDACAPRTSLYRSILRLCILAILAAQPALARPDQDHTADTAALEQARRLVDEVIARSYPELRSAEIKLKLFHSHADFFHTRFGIPQFFFGKRMRYLIWINPEVRDRQAPEAGLRAIIAHELAHVVYFRRGNRIRLLCLTRLLSGSFVARFERRTDLQAIARGYGPGLKEYRQWLYQNVPAQKLKEKERNYFSPAEIDAILMLSTQHRELVEYWEKHVPRNLQEISQPAPMK